jgi:acetylornithine deacetylase/succinyl-diaminopimelate desuccinylase-like protein
MNTLDPTDRERAAAAGAAAQEEVVRLCSELIRIESVNTGEPATIGDGEARAARYLQEQLEEVGLETTYLEAVPGRGNVICRLPGQDRSMDALLLHGHVDVVPADAAEWTVHPFSGAVQDGYVWGRGAVDMKGMVAMTVALARQYRAHDYKPSRDLVLSFMSDEEAGGAFGAHWLVDNHPELFAGVAEAISEVGGFSIPLGDERRAYLVAAAEKGFAWATLKATGTAGHGSMVNHDNAVSRVAAAVTRLGDHRFPIVHTATVDAFLSRIHDLTGIDFPEQDLEGAVGKIGPVSRLVSATLRNMPTPPCCRPGTRPTSFPPPPRPPSTAACCPDSRNTSGTKWRRSSATRSRSTGCGSPRWSTRSRVAWSMR